MMTPFETVVVFIMATSLATAVLLLIYKWKWVLGKVMRYVLEPVGRFIMANLFGVAILATVFVVPYVIIYRDSIWNGMMIVIRHVFNGMIISSLVIIIIFVVGVFKDTHRRGVVDDTTEKRK